MARRGRLGRSAGVAAGVLVLLGCAQAASADCFISVTSSLSFGAYSVFSGTPADATATMSYMCNKNNDTHVRFFLSTGSSSTFNPRTLRSGSFTLSYNIFTDASYAQIWGDGTGGTGSILVANPPNNVYTQLTLYGRIPAGQDVPVGTYSDTITVTMLW